MTARTHTVESLTALIATRRERLATQESEVVRLRAEQREMSEAAEETRRLLADAERKLALKRAGR